MIKIDLLVSFPHQRSIQKATPPLAPPKPSRAPVPFQVPACLASACLGCVCISYTHLEASCLGLECGERARFLELGREAGSGGCKLSSDVGAAQLCVLFAPWPEADSYPNPPSCHTCPLEPELGGGWEDCYAQGLLPPFLESCFSPQPKLSPVAGEWRATATSLCPGLLLPACGSLGVPAPPVRQPDGLTIAWHCLALRCWNQRLPSQVFLLRWQ